MSNIFTVFGATGNQGGSVIRAILADPVLSKEFKLRGITRDVNKPAAKALASRGVEMVSADLSSPAPAVAGAHTVFLVTNFWETMSRDTEVAQGKAVADACKAAGVKHLIFSSLIDVSRETQGRLTHVSHFDGKAEVERYIGEIGVPATFVQMGLFASGYFDQIRKTEDGSYVLASPVPGDTAQIPIFDPVSDAGKFVKAAIKHNPSPSGNHIHAAAAYITPNQLVADFSEVIGRPAKYQQVPNDVFKSFLPPPAADELLDNMLLLNDVGYYAGADLGGSLKLLEEKPVSWKEFVQANKEKWL